MDVREFVKRVEAAHADLMMATAERSPGAMRDALTGELRELEMEWIAGGQEPHAARSASWKRAKVLHGLGYPVDFGWLHEPVAKAA